MSCIAILAFLIIFLHKIDLVKELVGEFSKDETAQVVPFWTGPFTPLLILNDIKLVKVLSD